MHACNPQTHRWLVVFGKGVGFRRAPYELKDLSGIERTFYGFGSSSLNALSQIPEDIVLLASDIMEHAAEVIDVDFNPNVPVTLADHIQFAIQRLHDGLAISTPLAFDVSHLYPKEYAVGKRALTLVSTRLGIELPEAEATNVALHIINAESERGVMGETLLMAEAMDLIVQIVERRIGRTIDREFFSYARFMMHLRFLVARLMAHESSRSGVSELLTPLVTAYPETHACVREIVRRLEEDYGWHCDELEELYLTVHIQRVKNG